jgi:hypothetical protein
MESLFVKVPVKKGEPPVSFVRVSGGKYVSFGGSYAMPKFMLAVAYAFLMSVVFKMF